jgi:hypothetical protein
MSDVIAEPDPGKLGGYDEAAGEGKGRVFRGRCECADFEEICVLENDGEEGSRRIEADHFVVGKSEVVLQGLANGRGRERKPAEIRKRESWKKEKAEHRGKVTETGDLSKSSPRNRRGIAYLSPHVVIALVL